MHILNIFEHFEDNGRWHNLKKYNMAGLKTWGQGKFLRWGYLYEKLNILNFWAKLEYNHFKYKCNAKQYSCVALSTNE